MEEEEEKEVRMKITGMHCASCAVTIEKHLKRLEGINSSNLSYSNEEARVKGLLV